MARVESLTTEGIIDLIASDRADQDAVYAATYTPNTDASQFNTGTLADARLPTASNAATVGSKAPMVEVVNVVAAAGAAQTLSAIATATINRLTLTAGLCALTFPTLSAGASFILILTQDATGSRLITWPTSIMRWVGGVAPTLSTGANKVDYLSFICADGVKWSGFVSGLDVR